MHTQERPVLCYPASLPGRNNIVAWSRKLVISSVCYCVAIVREVADFVHMSELLVSVCLLKLHVIHSWDAVSPEFWDLHHVACVSERPSRLIIRALGRQPRPLPNPVVTVYVAHEHVRVSVPGAYSLQLVKIVQQLWVLPGVDTAQQRHGISVTLAFPGFVASVWSGQTRTCRQQNASLWTFPWAVSCLRRSKFDLMNCSPTACMVKLRKLYIKLSMRYFEYTDHTEWA